MTGGRSGDKSGGSGRDTFVLDETSPIGDGERPVYLLAGPLPLSRAFLEEEGWSSGLLFFEGFEKADEVGSSERGLLSKLCRGDNGGGRSLVISDLGVFDLGVPVLELLVFKVLCF